MSFAATPVETLPEGDATSILTNHSTITTNYTTSNLPGPGRNLGNLYSWAGSHLERRLVKRSVRASIKLQKKYEEAGQADLKMRFEEALTALRSTWMIRDMFMSNDERVHDRACEILLVGARAEDVTIQANAFERIIRDFMKRPSKFRSSFARVFEKHDEDSDTVTLSWKRSGVEYSAEWLYLCTLASHCVSSRRSSFFEAVSYFDNAGPRSLHFWHFGRLILSCGDTTEMSLAIHFLQWYWNSYGVDEYVRRKGLDDTVLFILASGLLTHLNLPFPWKGRSYFLWGPLIVSVDFMDGILGSLRNGSFEIRNKLEGHGPLPAMLPTVFKLHCHLHSDRFQIVYEDPYALIKRPWSTVCHMYLPNVDLAKLRQTLLRLEDIYGPAMRMRREEKKKCAITSSSDVTPSVIPV